MLVAGLSQFTPNVHGLHADRPARPRRHHAWGRKRYKAELEQMGDLLVILKHRATEGTVTFVYAAHDEDRNSAVALKDLLDGL